ncbi:hypothetical protein POD19_12715 [Micrococcus sp. GPGPB33]|uniref:hypothetical protein n=1 Tax=Micrococcus TaxID=1269 RepID=UPI001E33EFA5|nr:hypothetical protein [Micrococcus luteus]MCD0182455.1 hypothetical protein [Micrococcus luteus]
MSDSIDVHTVKNGILEYEVSTFGLGEPPTKFVHVSTPSDGWSLGALEDLTEELRRELGWTSGAFEEYSKNAGGVGADGLTTIMVALQVVQTLPTVQFLLDKLQRSQPGRDDRDSARRRAESAILSKYPSESRSSLKLRKESESTTHWSFDFDSMAGDTYTVQVYGTSGGTAAEFVTWESAPRA